MAENDSIEEEETAEIVEEDSLVLDSQAEETSPKEEDKEQASNTPEETESKEGTDDYGKYDKYTDKDKINYGL